MDRSTKLRWPTWIGVVVDDLEAQSRFWGELLGVSPVRSGDDFVAFDLGSGRSFELIERSEDAEYDGVRFQVGFEVEDIGDAYQALKDRGAQPIGDIVDYEGAIPWAYFRDPEGNVFSIKARTQTDSSRGSE